MMAVPAKPQARRNKPAPAIFANPPAAGSASASAKTDPVSLSDLPPTVAAAIDPAAATAAIEQISISPVDAPAIDPVPVDDAAPKAAIAAGTDIVETAVEKTGDLAVSALDQAKDGTQAVATQVADTVDDATQIGAQALETVPAHPADPAPVSSPLKGLFPMATVYDSTKAQDLIGDISTRTKGALEKSVRFAEEVTEFTKGNVEAIVASSRVAAKGIEALAQDAAETAKHGFEQAQTALKSFTQVKSPTELFQLQSDYAKTTFDQLVANASKASEQLIKLAGDVAQPLSNRYALASEKVKSAAL
jgi:phasin family protein